MARKKSTPKYSAKPKPDLLPNVPWIGDLYPELLSGEAVAKSKPVKSQNGFDLWQVVIHDKTEWYISELLPGHVVISRGIEDVRRTVVVPYSWIKAIHN